MVRLLVLSIACFAVLASGAVAADAPAALLKVGFAERDITPEIGSEVPGGYGKSFCRSIHDPCKVRAMVLDDGKRRVALVGIDAGFIWHQPVVEIRKLIQQKCGIPPEAVLVDTSHSHSSGPLGIVQPGQYDHASPLVRSLAYEKSACADADYLDRVKKQTVAAVCEANDRRGEARCGVDTGIEDKVAFNRRLRMKNGRTYTHPGKGNPDIVGYAGPTDPTVGVLGAWDKDGKLLGCVVHYTCHATTSPGGISANYIYYLEKTIRGCLDPDAVVVFLQGASGDVTQVDNLNRAARLSGERQAQFVGGRIGAEAVKVLLSMASGPMGPLDARSKTLQVKRRVPRPERVARCLELVRQDPSKVGRTDWAFAKEIVLLDAELAKRPTDAVEIQAIQVGPAVFLANPAELFCEYGLEIRKRSKFPFTFTVGYANGFVGYVGTEEAFGPHGGGYETRLTSASNLEPTAGRRMVETSLELSSQLAPGKAPTHREVPPYKRPKNYRPVPPELD